jgi:hypothetical protein
VTGTQILTDVSREQRPMRLSAYLGAAAVLAALALGCTARQAHVSTHIATIDAKGTLLARGAIVRLSGHVQGPPGECFGLSVLLEQATGARQVHSVGVIEGTFTGARQPWTLSLSAPVKETFASGSAVAWGIGSGTGFVAEVSLHK